jgi:hypothetical protein
MFGGVLEWRPRPTPGCSAIEEEEEPFNAGIKSLLASLYEEIFYGDFAS